MVDLTKCVAKPKRANMIFKACYIQKEYIEALKKLKIPYTDFVRRAFEETFGIIVDGKLQETK